MVLVAGAVEPCRGFAEINGVKLGARCGDKERATMATRLRRFSLRSVRDGRGQLSGRQVARPPAELSEVRQADGTVRNDDGSRAEGTVVMQPSTRAALNRAVLEASE